jgi:hypothetical protein
MKGRASKDQEEGQRMFSQLDPKRVIHYLKAREKEEGGFSFVPDLYPDIEDTYYALRTFQLLKVDVDRNKTAKYLENINWKEVSLPRSVYMLTYLHLTTDMEMPPPLTDLLRKDWSGFRAIDAQYYSDEIKKLLKQHLNPLPFLSHFQFHARDNLQALRKKVSALVDHGIDFDKQEIIRWVQLCQNGDGGFGFYPGTTSFTENTYCALEILSKLNSSPRETDLCREYILNCQTKSGGFGRAPISFPFIESTFHAVTGWFFLDKMEVREK